MSEPQSVIVLVAAGLEDLLLQELAALVPEWKLRSRTTGELRLSLSQNGMLRFLCGSRLSSRILLELFATEIETERDLYEAIAEYAWEQELASGASIWIDASARKHDFLRNDMFVAQVVKDGICDRMRNQGRERPVVDRGDQSVRIQARVVGKSFWLAMDLGGGSLHARGYRQEQGEAPLRETTAAALLWAAGWRWGNAPILEDAAALPMEVLVDPMCGSGTFVIEAAQAALCAEPGIFRPVHFGNNWLRFPRTEWEAERGARRAQFLANRKEFLARSERRFFGFDVSPAMIEIAKRNAERAKVGEFLQFSIADVRKLRAVPLWQETIAQHKSALIIANPPYGERIGFKEDLPLLFQALGGLVEERTQDWTLGVLAENEELGFQLKLRGPKRRRVYNGNIACDFLVFIAGDYRPSTENAGKRVGEEQLALENRLRKRSKHLEKWRKRENIEAYRVYDCDMTEFRFRADLYGPHGIVVQEIVPPKSVSEKKAERRRQEFLSAIERVFQLPPAKIFLKERKRQRGKEQYEKLGGWVPHPQMLEVREGDARFFVNLEDYLDVGLFLDHRPLRKRLRSEAKDKAVLNLFSYTGALSVAAALGGAKRIVSVDLSKKYCQWMADNFALNKIKIDHEIFCGDVLDYLENSKEKFDIILLDPPTFSNSKRTETVFDVMADYLEYLRLCGERLCSGGELVFSTNAKRFRIDMEAVMKLGFSILETTNRTVPDDFQKQPPPHRSWLLKRNPS